MQEIVDVQIGQVKAGQGEKLLRSNAIGSCIAIAAYDAAKKNGALAHIMLPGAAPENKKAEEKTKYAANAINEIISQMATLGSKADDIEVALVGGANVLNKKDDTICSDNIESVLEILTQKNLKIKAKAVGGNKRRSIFLDIEKGIINYTEGDGTQIILWKA